MNILYISFFLKNYKYYIAVFIFNWLSQQDSNLRIEESKSSALSLGDGSIYTYHLAMAQYIGLFGFEPKNTCVRDKCLNRLAIALQNKARFIFNQAIKIFLIAVLAFS